MLFVVLKMHSEQHSCIHSGVPPCTTRQTCIVIATRSHDSPTCPCQIPQHIPCTTTTVVIPPATLHVSSSNHTSTQCDFSPLTRSPQHHPPVWLQCHVAQCLCPRPCECELGGPKPGAARGAGPTFSCSTCCTTSATNNQHIC